MKLKIHVYNKYDIQIFSEVKNVQNVIIIQNGITKSSVGRHGPPTNAKVESGI
jgi:hypothetical protein